MGGAGRFTRPAAEDAVEAAHFEDHGRAGAGAMCVMVFEELRRLGQDDDGVGRFGGVLHELLGEGLAEAGHVRRRMIVWRPVSLIDGACSSRSSVAKVCRCGPMKIGALWGGREGAARGCCGVVFWEPRPRLVVDGL